MSRQSVIWTSLSRELFVLTVVTRLTVWGEGAEVTEAVDTVEQREDKEGNEKPDKEVDIESVVSRLCQ